MSITLQPLQECDVQTCVTIYFSAFQNPHSLACWPRVPSIRAWWENMIRSELHGPGAHWLKAVPNATGAIVGFVKWQEPKPGVEPDTNLPEWPEEADQELCDETFGAWARAHRDLMGNEGHWYLEIIATDPAYQGKGAGSLMMQYGLKKADEQGVRAFLEASPDAVRLYEKAGFREARHLDTFINNSRVEGTMYRNLFMVRDAARKNDTR
ncbi:hypothetical protein CKM354_001107500 [Cercospora kikuchii]|uniref:N-acetyltransferase domain-containing protein n=1 Tax=Cercospora kikuchii TaxID=84275 RepID=A0A9P3FL45_9PEZI|nr:uncharacterized protein CKM354_001107500 [Cercospora kikuchii]GIZ48000.1 hypothetical protein CKM354_001107500 [Cercospora kikuchii]